MIWKGTKRFGIGMARTEDGDNTCTYIVARYRPTGNVAGAFRDNVAKTTDKRSCGDPRFIYDEETSKTTKSKGSWHRSNQPAGFLSIF